MPKLAIHYIVRVGNSDKKRLHCLFFNLLRYFTRGQTMRD